jgi:hypothetical protein
MDSTLANSLEALAKLLYLTRKSLHDSTAASIYVDRAEESMRAIATQLIAAPEFVCPVCGAQSGE